MAITSLQFLAFCVLSVILFLIFPKKHRWISLLISSVAFYLLSSSNLVVFIIITALTTWLASRRLEFHTKKLDEQLKSVEAKEEKKKLKDKAQKTRFLILVLTLILNIGILVCMKVFNHFSDAFAYIVGIFNNNAEADAMKLIMPLGISYYTFSSVGYLLDVYWKRYDSEKNFFRFFLFTIFFPRILQGPISRYNLLGAELKKPELRFRWDNFVVAMESILLGCFKKLVIADRASVFVSNTYLKSNLSGSIYVLAMILDAIQIYADFSGYMDIVSGVAKLFDIELEKNFNHPFLATSVPDFWRRWHMSLGSWFKDYVYYPITVCKPIKKLGKKVQGLKSAHLKKAITIVAPVMVTWLSTGLWHGTGVGYVMWGVYYGLLILLSVTFSEDIQKLLVKLKVRTNTVSYRIFQTLKIFVIFMGGRFLGTSMGLPHRIEIAKSILRRFVNFDIFSYGLDQVNFGIIVFGVMLLIAIAVIETKENIFVWFNKQNRLFCGIVILAMFFMVFLLGIYGTQYDSSNFMYQRF